MNADETIHATSVAIHGHAVLLIGPSGSGKSDLALRLIDRGAALVSDDYTSLTRTGDIVLADAPPTIVGLMEIRGIGLVSVPSAGPHPVALVVELFGSVDRLPLTPLTRTLAGVEVALMHLSPFEASAPLKVEWMLRHLSGDAGHGSTGHGQPGQGLA
ncbi:MAG: HPr kinase/phosphatase C-terminal domain-containing protein [Sphingobium sp.]